MSLTLTMILFIAEDLPNLKKGIYSIKFFRDRIKHKSEMNI